MASLGAKVLQTRSVELAMVQRVRLYVRSSFDAPDGPGSNGGDPGTLVCDEDEIVEQQVVSGIAYAKDEAKVTLVRVEDKPGVAAQVFGPLAESGINVDMIVQNISDDGRTTDLTFTVKREDYEKTLELLRPVTGQLGARDLSGDNRIAKVSVVGRGMRSHAGVAARFFDALAAENINIQMISTSEIKISVVVAERYLELAVRALHAEFGLSEAETESG